MLEFPIEYFDDEVREGFYVPSIMKHNWAAQMEMLHVVDKICKKYNIKYYLFAGTLLGAIRHGGFIPWDDDMDICMLRKDYMRLVKVLPKEVPPEYYVRNIHEDPTYRDVFTRLLNNDRIYATKEFWTAGHGFICNAGIDIFPLDYIPTNIEKRKDISHQLLHLCYIYKKYDDEGMSDELELKLCAIENTFNIKIKRDDTIPQQMYLLMEDILCTIEKDEAKSAYIALEWAQAEGLQGVPLECFQNSVRVPFENTTYEAPFLYDKLLSGVFGNYMKSVRVCNIHNYPWYQTIYDRFKKDFDIKDYEYSSDLLPDGARGEKWQQSLLDELNENMEVFNKASEMATKLIEGGDIQSGNVILEKCKDIAENVEAIEKKLKGNGRERVIFFTWKAEYWKYFEPYYFAEVNAGCEVLVIPVPFVRLKEDRSQSDEFIETEGFPEYVAISDFNNVNYGDIRVSRMYIQNPYDDKDEAVIMRPFFHSSSLTKYTNELIYVPWFELDEFAIDDERALYMMRYFTRMPGVVAADKIYLNQSQAWIKDFYVKDLCDWAGEETKDIWEDKIEIVNTNDLIDTAIEIEQISERKKVILYYIGTSQVLADAAKFAEKLLNNISVFEQYADKMKVKFYIEAGLLDNVKKYKSQRYSAIKAAVDKYKNRDWCEFIEAKDALDVNSPYIHTLVDEADAFYGDAGILLHLFSRAKKPVMMQNLFI